MLIGVPKEIKPDEYRVALTPAGAEMLVGAGHDVIIETSAGLGSGFTDDFYENAGASIVETSDEVWARADMIMKVKEPIAPEWPKMREGQVMFTYFHFAADEGLTKAVIDSKAIAIAYETVELPSGELPLLTPMSEVAGRMAVQEGAKYLEKPQGGLGVLLGGVPGVLPGKVLVLGGGVVGTHAAKMAAGLGARVHIMDINLERLRYLEDVMPANVQLLYSTRYAIRKQIEDSDLIVGAVLIPGAKAPSPPSTPAPPLLLRRASSPSPGSPSARGGRRSSRTAPPASTTCTRTTSRSCTADRRGSGASPQGR